MSVQYLWQNNSLRFNPNDPDVLSYLASYYGLKGDRSKVIINLNKVEKLTLTDVLYYVQLARYMRNDLVIEMKH